MVVPAERCESSWITVGHGLQVIGAGFGRTVTLSLQAALQRLGYTPCEHMTNLLEGSRRALLWNGVLAAYKRSEIFVRLEWGRMFSGHGATVDWPECSFD